MRSGSRPESEAESGLEEDGRVGGAAERGAEGVLGEGWDELGAREDGEEPEEAAEVLPEAEAGEAAAEALSDPAGASEGALSEPVEASEGAQEAVSEPPRTALCSPPRPCRSLPRPWNRTRRTGPRRPGRRTRR